jgi:hypothetical protein
MSMDTVVDAYLRGGYTGEQIGWYVASAGDVDGDSCDDMIFSSYAGVQPTVWICKYTGNAVTERSGYDVERAAMIDIYPNPVSKQMIINFEQALTTDAVVPTIRFYDVSGREVMSYVVDDNIQNNIAVDTHNLPAGIYFVDVQAGDIRTTHKVVKID